MTVKIQIDCDVCKTREKMEGVGSLVFVKTKDGKLKQGSHHLSKAEMIGFMVCRIREMSK